MLLLSKQEIQSILTIRDTINILESAFAEFANGNVDLPERTYIHSKENNGMTLFMPGYLKESHTLGTKIVTVYNGNKKYNLPMTKPGSLSRLWTEHSSQPLEPGL